MKLKFGVGDNFGRLQIQILAQKLARNVYENDTFLFFDHAFKPSTQLLIGYQGDKE